MSEIIKGYTPKCNCCGFPLVDELPSGEAYIVFTNREDAEREAEKYGTTAMEVQITHD